MPSSTEIQDTQVMRILFYFHHNLYVLLYVLFHQIYTFESIDSLFFMLKWILAVIGFYQILPLIKYHYTTIYWPVKN